jgi:hypothetical protein
MATRRLARASSTLLISDGRRTGDLMRVAGSLDLVSARVGSVGTRRGWCELIITVSGTGTFSRGHLRMWPWYLAVAIGTAR